MKTSAATTDNESVYYTIPGAQIAPPTPPILPVSQYSHAPTTTPSTAYAYQYSSNERARSTRTIGNAVMGVLLYFVGAFSTAIGIFGSFLNFIGSSWAGVNMLSIFLMSIIVLIVMLKRYRLARLRWWHRILWGIISTTGMLVLMFIGYAILSILMKNTIPPTTASLFFGGSLIIYGLLVMFLALW